MYQKRAVENGQPPVNRKINLYKIRFLFRESIFHNVSFAITRCYNSIAISIMQNINNRKSTILFYIFFGTFCLYFYPFFFCILRSAARINIFNKYFIFVHTIISCFLIIYNIFYLSRRSEIQLCIVFLINICSAGICHKILIYYFEFYHKYLMGAIIVFGKQEKCIDRKH